MKKIASIFLYVIIFYVTGNYAKFQATSKTVLANGQVPFSSISPEMVAGFHLEQTYAAHGTEGASFQAVLFGGRSTHSTSSKLARYFFPDNKIHLSVAEDDLLDGFKKKKDLLAQQFNIYTNNGDFRSEISISPEQSVVGLGVYWRQCFIYDPLKGDGLWVSISTALEQIRNRMNLKEEIINSGGGPSVLAGVPVVANMKQAFKQPQWLFGKIIDEVMTKAGLADIEVKIGYDQYVPDESSHMELYVGLIVPTGNKYNGEFIFEPIVGRGKYVGIMSGGSVGKDLWAHYYGDKKVVWEFAAHSEYCCKNKQKRSLDLMHKPWSRYIQLYADQAQAQEAADLRFVDRVKGSNLATPGINLLTRELVVSPGFSYDMNSAFVFMYDAVRTEVGYNLFFKRAEDVKLSKKWDPVFAIKYADGLGQTNPIRDITGNKYLEENVVDAISDTVLIPVQLLEFSQSIVQETDLDFLSAETPALFSHTLYVSIGGCFENKKYPFMVHGGSSYSFANNNAVINKWLLWLKGGFSF